MSDFKEYNTFLDYSTYQTWNLRALKYKNNQFTRSKKKL